MGRKRRSMNQIKTMPDDQKGNDLFEKYYKGQGIVPSDEWDTFMEHLKSDLIATFRVTGFREQSSALLRLIQSKFVDRLRGDEDEKDVPRPTPLQWYPGEMAWCLNATRQTIRRSTEMKKLHTFLVSETETGYISRQEAVSMIPPLLLDVRSHHAVLDLCAAPGSKTAQLVELLHSDGRLEAAAAQRDAPTGVVVANDRDNDRCYMMIHQVKRLQSPCVVVMRQDATVFPRLRLEPLSPGDAENDLLFDRILADVPCSGDGTLRKNPDLWLRWNPGLGVAEHFVQARIVRRGLELLRVGGKLVYSTCSLNPVEDEAVICSLLKQCGESVNLVDVSGQLPGLKTEPGLRTWKVMTKEGEWICSPDEVPAKHRRSLRPSLFPPPENDVNCPPLERCRRILPHKQNTGGFFLAVLEKVDNLPWMSVNRHKVEASDQKTEGEPKMECAGGDSPPGSASPPKSDGEAPASPAGNGNGAEKPPPAKKSRRTRMVYKEDPFLYMDPADPDWAKTRAFYGIADDAQPGQQLLFRCAAGKRRNFYFTNALLRRITRANSEREGVNFVNLGVKVFALCEDNDFGAYRLLQEGHDLFEQHVTRRRMLVEDRRDLMTLLRYEIPLMYRFSPAVRAQFDAMDVGPVVMEYRPPSPEERTEEGAAAVEAANGTTAPAPMGDVSLPSIRLSFSGWRGKVSLRMYVNKHERAHLMRLCGVLDPPAALEDKGLGGETPKDTADSAVKTTPSVEPPVQVEDCDATPLEQS